MTKKTERELVTIIDQAEANGITNSGSFLADQEEYLEYYQRQPFGDEIDGRSQVVSTDVLDLVEADMPSLARVFLGAGDPVEFQADSPSLDAISEARDKQILVSHIIRTIPESFRTQHAFLKSHLLSDIAALEYGVEDVESTRVKRYRGLSSEELAALMSEIEDEKDVSKVEVVEEDEENGDVLLRITYERRAYFINNIKVDDLIISKNAQSKNDAEVVGKRFVKTRSDLMMEGFSRELVDSLPTSSQTTEQQSLEEDRYRQQGGKEGHTSRDWANEEVKGEDVYIKVDYDGDGIAERRHVIKVGNVILLNEQFDHVPYAIGSSMLMPNNIVGLSRAQLMMTYQKVNSVLWRQSLDNTYHVNNPRTVYTDDIDLDDLLDIRFNGVIHSDGIPGQNLLQLETPYTADKTLQIVQYMEGKKTATAGSLVANAALEADDLHKETATRFKGMEEASKAKIELVSRVIAETGYRDLWEGIAWFATHYHNDDLEFHVLGREMAFNPTEWKFNHSVTAKVGTGAGDVEKNLQNLTGIYQLQLQNLEAQNGLTDFKKVYNTLSEMVRQSGRYNVNEFFNDPDQPIEMIRHERDMLKGMVQQLEVALQQQNPLAEAEAVKGQMNQQMEQLKQKFQGQLKMLEMQNENQKELAELTAKFDTEMADLKFKYDELAANTRFDYTKLEVENQTDIPGEGVNE